MAIDHQCMRAEQMATLKTNLHHLTATVAEHHKSLYGNGRPGLDDRMKEVEDKVSIMETTASEIRKMRNQLLLVIVAAVAAAWLAGCTRVAYRETRPDGTEIRAGYTYLLQDKSNRASLGDFTLEVNNSADPAVEAFKEGMKAGASQ